MDENQNFSQKNMNSGTFDIPESETEIQIMFLFQRFICAKQKHDSESCPIHVSKWIKRIQDGGIRRKHGTLI